MVIRQISWESRKLWSDLEGNCVMSDDIDSSGQTFADWSVNDVA